MAGKRLGNLPPALEFEDAELVAEDDSRVLNGLLGVRLIIQKEKLLLLGKPEEVSKTLW